MYYDSSKRYLTYNSYLRNRFKTKVFKVSLNINTTCPNIDGKYGRGGCIFCSASGSGDFAGDKNESITNQFKNVLNKLKNKWSGDYKYIAYFQANSNTYTSVEKLKRLVDEALSIDENIIGLALSTRPDCLSDEMLDYLSEINKKTFLQVELGVQSIYDKTLKYINRGHDYNCFLNAVEKLRKLNIDIVVHIINGLPGETETMMIETAKTISKLDVQWIKIHLLHILKNTPLADIYEKEKFPVLELDKYVEIVVEQLQYIKKDIVIHRLTGDGKKEDLIAPLWSLKKFVVLNEIDKYMREKDIWQGDLLK